MKVVFAIHLSVLRVKTSGYMEGYLIAQHEVILNLLCPYYTLL